MEFHKQLIARPDPGALAGAVTGFVNRLIPHDYAMLTLEDDVMRLLGMDRKDIVGVEGWDWKGFSPTGVAAMSRDVGEAVARPHGSGWEQMLKQGIESAFSMPLMTQRGKLGTLHLASRRRNAFHGVARELAEQVAMHVALAVDYACSSKEIESLKNRLTEPKVSVRLEVSEGGTGRTLRMVERDYIVQALRSTRGKVAGATGAAVKLGMKRTTLQSRVQKLKIQRSEYLDEMKESPKRQVS
jgi:transcriptional regulator with GAF, ATPase, and Fis domain